MNIDIGEINMKCVWHHRIFNWLIVLILLFVMASITNHFWQNVFPQSSEVKHFILDGNK